MIDPSRSCDCLAWCSQFENSDSITNKTFQPQKPHLLVWPHWHLSDTWKCGSHTSQENCWLGEASIRFGSPEYFGLIQLGWNSTESWAVASGLRVWSAMWKAKGTLGSTHQGNRSQLHLITEQNHSDYSCGCPWRGPFSMRWVDSYQYLGLILSLRWGYQCLPCLQLLQNLLNCFTVEEVPLCGSLSLPALAKVTTHFTSSILYHCLYLSRLSTSWFWPYKCDPWNLSS